MDIISTAKNVFEKSFCTKTWFERAIFFSWYCSTKDCMFCYMSGQKAEKKARRSAESMVAEALLCKALGWKIGFISGGHDAYTTIEFENVLKVLSEAAGEKLWINIGAIRKEELARYRPYIKGVVASIETINPELHKKVCPSKPIEPFEDMLDEAGKIGLQKAMTIIVGLGETVEDFALLEQFIRKHSIEKIHIYSLNPQKGTALEKMQRPTSEYQAEWIARTRIAFPKMDIQAGIWLDCVERVELLLRAGANSISKFPAIRHFGGREAQEVERQANKAGRKFVGTLTRMPETPASENGEVQEKINAYLKTMAKSLGNKK